MADILIKGLSLPKDDALSVIIYPDGVVEVQIGWNGAIPVYSNAFKATAEELTEHGDLIDKQKLVKELGKAWNVDDDQDFCNKSVWRIVEKEAPVVLERTT